MAYTSVGEDALRAENIDRVVKAIALSKYKMKQVVMEVKSSAWQESYYRESNKNLGVVEGVPRGAAFPVDSVDWEKNSAYMKKHAIEAEILWEDAMSDNIDVIQRTLLRVGSAVARSVDLDIYQQLSNGAHYSRAAGNTWNHATVSNRRPQDDLGLIISDIAGGANDNNNYEPDVLCLSPLDYASVAYNDAIIDSFDASGPTVMKNGVVGKILGLNVIVTPSVTADEALVAQSKVCGTYRVLDPLKTAVKREEGIKHIIRCWETGVPFVTDVRALGKITNTQA